MTSTMPPGRIWYFVAVLILVAGMGGAWLFVSPRLAALPDGLQRFVVPGSVELKTPETGTYTVFHEVNGVVDGELHVSENIDGLQVRVLSATDGTALPITAPALSESYSLGGNSGVSLLAFDVATPGRYRLTAEYGDHRTGPKAVLTVAHGLLGRVFGIAFGAIGICSAAAITALVIVIVTAVKRSRARVPANTATPVA